MNYETASDEEILEHLEEQFEEDGRINLNYIDFEVVDGSIAISGRVTSEEELQNISELMADTLEIEHYKNTVWVDDSLSYEDPDDNSPDLKNITFDDNEIEDNEYSDDDEEEESYF